MDARLKALLIAWLLITTVDAFTTDGSLTDFDVSKIDGLNQDDWNSLAAYMAGDSFKDVRTAWYNVIGPYSMSSPALQALYPNHQCPASIDEIIQIN